MTVPDSERLKEALALVEEWKSWQKSGGPMPPLVENDSLFSLADACSFLLAKGEWRSMETAPKDGSEFLVRFPKQGNVKQLCRWDRVHKQWMKKGEVFFPDIHGCEWIAIPGDTK